MKYGETKGLENKIENAKRKNKITECFLEVSSEEIK
jgi:hypothetical protein